MRLIIAALVLLASIAVPAAAQQRQANPPRDLWCRDMDVGEGTAQICMAYTLEQCLASRTTQKERCYLNPIYEQRLRR